MRHSKRRHVLGVTGPHRSAMMGNLSVALITHGRIETTLAKKAEQANDAARKLHFRRLAVARVRDKKAVAKLFDERAAEFANRPGGYTRIYKVGQRIGDAAEMALIELIDASDEGYDKPKRKAAPKAKTTPKAEAPTEVAEVAEPEAVVEAEAEAEAEATEEAPVEPQPEAEAAEAESSDEAEDSESKKDA